MTDDELTNLHIRIIAGDNTALPEFEAAMRPLVRGYLRRKGLSDEDADEVWNDTFLIGIGAGVVLEPVGVGLRKFVLRVAHNAAVDRIRWAVAHPEAPLENAESQTSPGRSIVNP